MTLLGDVPVEEVLVQENPYAAVLLDGRQQGQMCPHTFQHMPGPLPCTLGSNEFFGSEEVSEDFVSGAPLSKLVPLTPGLGFLAVSKHCRSKKKDLQRVCIWS